MLIIVQRGYKPQDAKLVVRGYIYDYYLPYSYYLK